ncbi:MAG: YIP1 family protein [Mariprofundus sp.]
MQYFDKNKPIQTLVPAMRDIITSPQSFFTTMPAATFHSNAMFFASIVIFTASFIAVPFHSLGVLFLTPVIWSLSLISLWVWSKYMSWAVKTLAKSKLGPATSFQITAYASLPLILSAVPYIGAVAGLFNMYLLWVALVKRCHVSSMMALIIIAIPTLMLAVSLFVLSGLLVQLLPQLA